MKTRLLKLLVCPECKQALQYHKREQQLVCAGCRLAYPVRDGIPVLLRMEARQTERR